MKLFVLSEAFSVCQIDELKEVDFSSPFVFLGKTDEELSLVCETKAVPKTAKKHDDGWRTFRMEGVLDFSLVGILAKISGVLSDNGIPIFAVSTYNTDYVLVKEERFPRALEVLRSAGYEIADG